MSKMFEGRVALITGASSGIGRTTALAFAEEGAKVAIAARRVAELDETVRAIQAKGGEAIYVATDVTKPEQVERLVKTTVERFGRLDFAFNNAGVLGTPFVPTPDYKLETWDQVISVNLTGVFLSMKYEIPAMLASGGGAIVNMSSIAGKVGGGGGIAYYASKHGVIGATKAAALEYAAKGIRINAICPAVIKTEMADQLLSKAEAPILAAHPIGRFGVPEEVSGVVTFLCSSKASFMTGHAYAIDGGLLAR
jgi:NAD(P)-dependent dehydrogenase (short-subunit alcohol dehydrogenase family)